MYCMYVCVALYFLDIIIDIALTQRSPKLDNLTVLGPAVDGKWWKRHDKINVNGISKTKISNILTVFVLRWILSSETDHWMDLWGTKTKQIVHKDTGELVEMYCPEKDGHVQLTHCGTWDSSNSWCLFLPRHWVSLRVVSLADCNWWVMFLTMMLWQWWWLWSRWKGRCRQKNKNKAWFCTVLFSASFCLLYVWKCLLLLSFCAAF